MKRYFFLYLSLITIVGIFHISLGVNYTPMLQEQLYDIVDNNNFKGVAPVKEKFVEEVKKQTDYQVTAVVENIISITINNIFLEPVIKAINKKKYDLAYFLVKEANLKSDELKNFHISTNDKELASKIHVDLLNKDKSREALLELIIKSGNQPLINLAESLLATLLLQKFQAFRADLDSHSLAKTIKILFGDLIEANLGKDRLKRIIIYLFDNMDLSTDQGKDLVDFVKNELKKIGIDLPSKDSPERDYSFLTYRLTQYALGKGIGWMSGSEGRRAIIPKKANINERDILKEDTLLILAIKNNKKAVAPFLEAGANVTLRGEWNQTPLMAAIMTKDTGLVDELFKHGANVTVNAQDALGRTALIALTQNPEASSLQTQIIGQKSTSPLENAEIIIGKLIENGANINIKDAFGKTALDYAQGKPTLIAALEKGASKQPSGFSLQEKLALMQTITTSLESLAEAKRKL